jgi:hypothetical protein
MPTKQLKLNKESITKLLQTIKEFELRWGDDALNRYCGYEIEVAIKSYLNQSRIKELEALVEIERDMNNDLDEHFSACNECMPSGSGGVCNKYSELRGYKQALADIIEILKRK